ncbi:hypothetical protein EUA98_04040 [Pengzhenrongella frigida]|uniref:Uncharacterized protein n=2 Tax=Pengzhenrongella frigida TaxID=1259133 RepID=A0A4Q5N2L8_9MICO|nr:hypothetical protein EUA98_04040 [Cellulomonas sp. HLT2-17]
MEQTHAPVAGRRFLGGLSPRMTAFVAIDAVLLLGFLAVLAFVLTGGLGGSTEQETPAAGASSRPTQTSSPASDEPAEASTVTFALPSGNIACEVGSDAATCTIANSTATVPADETCAGVVGVKLTVTAEGAAMPCVEGAAPGAAAEGTAVLEYGQSETVGDFTCTSSSTGVTCKHDPTGKGFKLARATSELF